MKMKTIMLTIADYPDHPDWAEMIRANRDRFCKLVGGYVVYEFTPPIDTGRMWVRVPLILEMLEAYDRVMWVDADAVLFDMVNEEDLPDRLAFAHDAGGINDGVTVTVKRDVLLWKVIWELRHLKDSDPIIQGLHANGVLRSVNPAHDVLPLDLWNSRWPNFYMKIRHFAAENNRYELVKRACGGERI